MAPSSLYKWTNLQASHLSQNQGKIDLVIHFLQVFCDEVEIGITASPRALNFMAFFRPSGWGYQTTLPLDLLYVRYFFQYNIIMLLRRVVCDRFYISSHCGAKRSVSDSNFLLSRQSDVRMEFYFFAETISPWSQITT